MYQAGETHDLTGVSAGDSRGNKTTLAGRYELVEFCPREPSAYVWADEWIVIPAIAKHKEDWENYIFYVDAYDLFAKLDPDGYASMVKQEEEMMQEEVINERIQDAANYS